MVFRHEKSATHTSSEGEIVVFGGTAADFDRAGGFQHPCPADSDRAGGFQHPCPRNVRTNNHNHMCKFDAIDANVSTEPIDCIDLVGKSLHLCGKVASGEVGPVF